MKHSACLQSVREADEGFGLSRVGMTNGSIAEANPRSSSAGLGTLIVSLMVRCSRAGLEASF
jgi:hypothetical protein